MSKGIRSWWRSHEFAPLDWSMRRGYRLPVRALGEPYFISWQFEPKPARSANGIINGGINPVTTAQYALWVYEHRSLEPEPNDSLRDQFLSYANFLRDAADADGKLPYRFRHDSYGVSVPWYSAMPQGEAASVLLRAYALTRDLAYIKAAQAAIDPLKRDVRDGGVSYIRGRDVFFEEAASAERPVHVLNGHLYAAFGVWELLEHGFGDAALRELHIRAVDTLRRWLPEYDVNGWSRYALAVDDDNVSHIATMAYHQFHIAQLAVYAEMTGEHLFREYANRWRHSLDDLSIRCRYFIHSAGRMARGLRRVVFRSQREWRPLR